MEAVCHEGTAAVLELAQLGAEFTRSKTGSYHLTKEGGHSHNRIVHAADATGAEIERALLAKAEAAPQHHHPPALPSHRSADRRGAHGRARWSVCALFSHLALVLLSQHDCGT